MNDLLQPHQQQRPCSASELPLLVLLRIFQELGPRDIALACVRVCKSWHAAIHNEPILWRSLCRSRYLIAPPCPSPPVATASASGTDSWTDWRSLFVARFSTDLHVLKDLVISRIQKHQYRFFQEDDPIFEQIDSLLRLDNQAQVSQSSAASSTSVAVAPVAADVLTHVMFTSTFSYPSLGFAAWTLLRHLRWSWILQQLDTPWDSPPEYFWSLLSAAQMLHLDPVSQVIKPLLAQLDQLAQDFTHSHPTHASEPHRQRLASLGHFLFHTKGFKGNKVNYHSPSNSHMHTFLSTRQGLPISLCVLLASVACRLHPPVPISLVAFPAHFLARFDDPAVPLDQATQLLDPFNYDPLRPQAWMAPVAFWQQSWANAGAMGAQFLPQLVEPVSARHVMVRMLNNVDTAVKMQLRGQSPEDGLLEVLYVSNLMLLRLDREAAAAAAGGVGVGARTAQRIEVVVGMVMELWYLLDAPLVMQSVRRLGEVVVGAGIMQAIGPALGGPLWPVEEIQWRQGQSAGTAAAALPVDAQEQDAAQGQQQQAAVVAMHDPGTLFVHKVYGYLAVILSSDAECTASQEWQQAQGVSRLAYGAQQPYYQSLALDAAGTRYVAHENIYALTDRPMDEISLDIHARVMRLLAKPEAAKSWLEVLGHGNKAKQVIVERPLELGSELQKMLVVGRHFDLFDWDRYRFVIAAGAHGAAEGVQEGPAVAAVKSPGEEE